MKAGDDGLKTLRLRRRPEMVPYGVVGASVEAGRSIHQAGGKFYLRRIETTRPAHSSEVSRIQERLSTPFGIGGDLF